ncbi:UxaA family hydrolase [Pseudaestuariivita atlantica]|uniref:SAF domain-containing protein n=1 Tax=Pseudaestuariivita atlantica TaxID=1317121 RepID=A0A0L1JMP5_9RHOB|nr:UxaA family hydrolase [Pseudaestuariivita atlantica]KNG92688.1 hypothetical protein ATO11_16905 [Pseudaestuariivita atlantica]
MDGHTTLLRLHADDNVLVALGPVGPGEVRVGDTATLMLRGAVTLGHKVAARAIASGETIVKYGMPIGVATADIAQGDHVHVHNIASRYTATHYRSDDAGLSDE